MTQKISPAVRASAWRMASAMRALSGSEIMPRPSPAPRAAAAAERAPTATETPAPEAAARRSAAARQRHQDQGTEGAAARRADDQYPDAEQDDDDDRPDRRIVRRPLLVYREARFGARLPAPGVAGQHLDDGGDAAVDAAGEIAGP